jgi:geranylgeranyl diphosphate synthase type I
MPQITDVSPASVFPRLTWAEELLVPALKDAVAALPEAESMVARYHRGWCEADGTAVVSVSGRGKAVRPALALLSAQAVGGSARSALPGAVAVELVHDFTLLHDDVIDGDALRRHRPAAWSVFGTPAAVLAGDALLVAALRAVCDVPDGHVAAAVRELVTALLELVEGQSRDVAFEVAAQVSVGEYLAMAEGKTGSLMGCACALGGLLAGADSVLGIWGRTARSGKPVGADLAARKKSLPVAAALQGTDSAAERLRDLYSGERPLREEELDLVRDLVEKAGGRQAAEEEARRQLQAALRALSYAAPTADVYRQLQEIAWAMVRRDS